MYFLRIVFLFKFILYVCVIWPAPIMTKSVLNNELRHQPITSLYSIAIGVANVNGPLGIARKIKVGNSIAIITHCWYNDPAKY